MIRFKFVIWYLKRVICYFFFRTPLFMKMVDKNPQKALDMKWNSIFMNPINWDRPCTLNEKMQWLQINTDTTKWSDLADKFTVRTFVEGLGGGRYLTKLYGIWNSVDDIDYSRLPDKFVIKCTHDNRSTYVVRDKKELTTQKLNKQLQKHFKRKFGYITCEPHYTRIRPRIMAEELLEQGNGQSIIDYKFCMIHSKPVYCMVCYDRPASDEKGTAVKDIYHISPWAPWPEATTTDHNKHAYLKNIPCPENYKEMLQLAEKLSEDFPLIWVDMYNISGRIVLGELTFTRETGRILYLTDHFQEEFGKLV